MGTAKLQRTDRDRRRKNQRKARGHWFNEVTVIKELHNPYAPPWENRPVLLCRSPKNPAPLSELWPKLKNWD